MTDLQTGFRVAPQTKKAIRQIAANARSALGLPAGRVNWAAFLEKLHSYGIVVDIFEASSAPVGQGIEACWIPESNTLYIQDAVYADAVRGGARATFTIAHELGHILLAHRRTINRVQESSPMAIWENSEWQANTFAAEFAMPLTTIRSIPLCTATQIASYFGVSLQAAEVRLRKLRADGEI